MQAAPSLASLGSLHGEASYAAHAIASLREELKREHHALLPAASLLALLTSWDGGVADNSRREEFAAYWEGATPQTDERGVEVYPFKGSLVSYFDLDTARAPVRGPRRSQAHRYVNGSRESHSRGVVAPLEESGFVVEHIDQTTQHNVSYYRVHKAWPLSADASPLTRTMLRLMHEVLASGRDATAATEDVEACEDGRYEAMMTAFRVTKSVHEPKYREGEPGPEGVHQDAAVLTAVTLMRRDNVATGSGANRVWSLEQPAGKPSAADVANATRLLTSRVLIDRFDTLLLMDRRVKHEACAIAPADAAQAAVRDVLTIEVRAPAAVAA